MNLKNNGAWKKEVSEEMATMMLQGGDVSIMGLTATVIPFTYNVLLAVSAEDNKAIPMSFLYKYDSDRMTGVRSIFRQIDDISKCATRIDSPREISSDLNTIKIHYGEDLLVLRIDFMKFMGYWLFQFHYKFHDNEKFELSPPGQLVFLMVHAPEESDPMMLKLVRRLNNRQKKMSREQRQEAKKRKQEKERFRSSKHRAVRRGKGWHVQNN